MFQKELCSGDDQGILQGTKVGTIDNGLHDVLCNKGPTLSTLPEGTEISLCIEFL